MSRHCIAHLVLFVVYITIAAVLLVDGAHVHSGCALVAALAYLVLAKLERHKDDSR